MPKNTIVKNTLILPRGSAGLTDRRWQPLALTIRSPRSRALWNRIQYAAVETLSTGERPTMLFDNECKRVNDPAREERLAFANLPRYKMEEAGRR